MKILLLKDRVINNTLLGQVQLQVETVYKGLGVDWVIEERDYSSYPIEAYYGGYYGIQHSWLKERCAEVYKKYSEEIDQVVFLIASDNWILDRKEIVSDKGVWGWNISGQYSGYGVQQCRFAQVVDHSDERNVNNSAGTLYHELHHDHDTYIFVNTGESIEKLAGVKSWDNDVTHGGSSAWNYIRSVKDNSRSIDLILPTLVRARDTRKLFFLKKKLSMLEQIKKLMLEVRALQTRARGDVPILVNNKCVHDK